MISLQEKLAWMGSYLRSEGNYKKEQEPGLNRRLNRELKNS
jgi:hypothetical protein